MIEVEYLLGLWEIDLGYVLYPVRPVSENRNTFGPPQPPLPSLTSRVAELPSGCLPFRP